MKKVAIKIAMSAIRLRINTLALHNPERASKLAWKIFGTPRKGKLQPHHKAFLESADWNIITAPKYAIQCYEWKGKGKKVLLAHGWESNSARWKKLILHLRKSDAHIIAMDAPAHGASSGNLFDAVKYANCMNEVVKHYQPDYIIGHSVGGFATAIFLANYPNTIEKAIIMGAPSNLSDILDHYERLLKLSKKAAKAMRDGAIPRFGFSIDEVTLSDNFAKRITAKGLVIHDVDDNIAKFSDGKAIYENWKDAVFMETKGLGHGLYSQAVNQRIASFLGYD